MSSTALAAIKNEIKAARDAYEQTLTEQADAAHRDIVQPFCTKWGVSFGAGMGSWSFHAPKNAERDPGLPFEPSSFSRHAYEGESAEDISYFSYGLPDAFWQEFQDVVDALTALESATGRDSFIAGYFRDAGPVSA